METFEELPLEPNLKRAISDLGFTTPSPIQAQTLPLLLGEKTDFIGLAATGTGKTAAFSIPLLQRIQPRKKGIQALILCPTRELCMQVAEQVRLLGKYLGISALPIYGGAGYEEQLRGLRNGVPVVVGTPGRVIDHLKRGTLKLVDVHTVILDEADEMISMGFREAIDTVLAETKESNTWLFSATMSPEVRRVANQYLSQPKMVQVNRTEMLSSTVEQSFYMTQEKNKPEVLCKLIDAADDFYGLIFCQTKSLVIDLTRYLSERSYKVDSLHGDMSQASRETTMLAFREKRVKILVCTDVASRGLDVKDISHVINFSLPRELDAYVHRIGRTARSGKTGLAMSLVTPSHRHLLNKIEHMTKSRFVEGVVPTRKAIGMKKIANLLVKFNEQQSATRAVDLMDDAWKQALENMSPQEVAARFLSLMYPWVFAEKAPTQMARPHTAVTPAPSMPAQIPGNRPERTPGKSSRPSSREQQDAYRDEKRRLKREQRKPFAKGFQKAAGKKVGGDSLPRRKGPAKHDQPNHR